LPDFRKLMYCLIGPHRRRVADTIERLDFNGGCVREF